MLGVTHEEIGGIITQRWNLPINLQKAVLNHHAPDATQEFTPCRASSILLIF